MASDAAGRSVTINSDSSSIGNVSANVYNIRPIIIIANDTSPERIMEIIKQQLGELDKTPVLLA